MGKFITFTVKKFISIIQNLNTFVDIPKDDIDKICETEKIFQLAEKIMSSFLLSPSSYDLMGINELENCLVLLQTIVSYHTIPLGTIISKNYDCGKTLVQLDKLIVEFPVNINNYHEIFLGGGSVLLTLLTYAKNKIINING